MNLPPSARSFYGPPYDESESLKPDEVRLIVRLGESYIKPFYVIVEMYDKKGFGRGKRLYNRTFTESERKVISSYYGKLYDWFLRRGIPHEGVEMSMTTYTILQRAANFFASL